MAQQKEKRARRLAKLERHLQTLAGGNGSSPALQVPRGRLSAAAGAAGASAGGAAGVAPEVQAIYDLLNDASGYGALIHNMPSSEVHDVVDMALDNDNNIPWVYWDPSGTDPKPGPINDCYSGTNGNIFCSAWAWLHRSVLPIVYNYPEFSSFKIPNLQHQVGVLVGAQALAEARDTTMYVIDGDSWGRYAGGIDETDHWFKDDIVAAGHDPAVLTYRCWANDPASSCGQDADTCPWPYCWDDGLGGYSCGAHVGENGERWAAMFMNEGLTKEAMLRQCPWEDLSDAQTRSAYVGALNGFYDAALALQDAGQLGLPDGETFLDTEVDVDIGTDGEALDWFEDMLLAVVVQDNRCEQQIPGDSRCSDGTWYPDGEPDEEIQLWDSFLAACRLSDLLYRKQGRNVPVIAGRFLSNAVVVPDEWRGFRNGGDLFANEVWLEDYTSYCCSDDILQGQAPWHYACF
jgi:hypothetical protein